MTPLAARSFDVLATNVGAGFFGQWLGVAILICALVFLGRYIRSGKAGEALQILKTANEVLAEQHMKDSKRIAELEQSHSLEPIISRVVELFAHHDQTIRQALVEQERRAQERHEGEMVVLQLIADRLGPDPNGH